jgi:hypothetical protein
MFHKICSVHTGFSRLFSLLVFVILPVAGSPAQERMNAQISNQGLYLAARPAKITIKLPDQPPTVGSRAQLALTLWKADNTAAPAKEPWQCKVAIQYPSGKSVSQTVLIKPGDSSATFEFSADEPGVTTISASPPPQSGARSDKTEIVVLPAQKMGKGKKPKIGSLLPLPTEQVWSRSLDQSRETQPTLQLARYDLGEPFGQVPPHGGGNHPEKKLRISVGDVGGDYVANGKDSVQITATYESDDLSPAPTDIHVWFRWDFGTLDPPQPLVIAKGTFMGKSALTSASPTDVHFKFDSSTPHLRAQGDTDCTFHFVPYGAALTGPDQLSIVDNPQVTIVFFDENQKPVAPGRSWQVNLSSKNSKLHFTPQSFQVTPNSPTTTAALYPVSFGSDTVAVVVEHYTPLPLPVKITGWMVLGLCIGGGLAGGLAAYNKFRGSVVWRMFLGVLGGGVLCWMYVFLALPSISNGVAHSLVSVLFVAILGGYLGTSVLDFAARKFGFAGGDAPAAAPNAAPGPAGTPGH